MIVIRLYDGCGLPLISQLWWWWFFYDDDDDCDDDDDGDDDDFETWEGEDQQKVLPQPGHHSLQTDFGQALLHPVMIND